jgi:hypothetical protein
MKHIEDKIVLLGLITSMVPFKYENSELSSNLLIYVEKVDLENSKKELEMLLENPLITDEEKNELHDEIYFINKIMESLEMR